MSRSTREQRPLQRLPAKVSLCTRLGMACIGLVALMFFLVVNHNAWNRITHPNGHWHKPYHKHFYNAEHDEGYKFHGPQHPTQVEHGKPSFSPRWWVSEKIATPDGFSGKVAKKMVTHKRFLGTKNESATTWETIEAVPRP